MNEIGLDVVNWFASEVEGLVNDSDVARENKTRVHLSKLVR